MKSFIFATIVLIFISINLQSQTKDTVYVVTKDTVFIQNAQPNTELKTKRISTELGIALGTPAIINLIVTQHFSDFLVKLSGIYLDKYEGIQIDFGYKFSESRYTYHAITLGAGYLDYSAYLDNNGHFNNRSYWEYASLQYLLNTKGFLFSAGLSAGDGSFSNPQLMLQIGYSYQFGN